MYQIGKKSRSLNCRYSLSSLTPRTSQTTPSVQHTLAVAVIRAAPEAAVLIHTAPARVGALLLPAPTTVIRRTHARALGCVRVTLLVGKVANLAGAALVGLAVACLLLDASRAAAAVGVDWCAAVNAGMGLLNVAFVEHASDAFTVLRGLDLLDMSWMEQLTASPDGGHMEMSHLQESARGKSSVADTAARRREKMVTAFMVMMWVGRVSLLSGVEWSCVELD